MILGNAGGLTVKVEDLIEKIDRKIEVLNNRRKHAKLKGNSKSAARIAKVIETFWSLINKIEESEKKFATVTYEGKYELHF